MTENITRDIWSRNKAPNMTIGNTEETWPSVQLVSTRNGYSMTGDSAYTCYDREIYSLPISHAENTFIAIDDIKIPIMPVLEAYAEKELKDIQQRIKSCMYGAIPDDVVIRSIPIHPDISETYARVEDVIALAQRFNEPEAALLVAAAQDFLAWLQKPAAQENDDLHTWWDDVRKAGIQDILDALSEWEKEDHESPDCQ